MSATDTTKSTTKTPIGLSTRARALWRAVAGTYELRADELVVLEDAARAVTDVDRLRKAMVGEPLLTEGSKGQLRGHPLLAEIRASTRLASTLLRQLGLPDDPAAEGDAAGSHAARQLVARRWRGTAS